MKEVADLWSITPHHLEKYADKIDEVDIRYLWCTSQEAQHECCEFVYDDKPWYWAQPKKDNALYQNNDK